MANGVWADASKLKSFERTEVVRVLKVAIADARGDRAIGMAYLLAALEEDYPVNKSKLLDALKECRRLSYPHVGQCADFISEYLMDLARRGDLSLSLSLCSTFRIWQTAHSLNQLVGSTLMPSEDNPSNFWLP